MPIYTVQNPETNRTVKFDWADATTPPTDTDIQEVFDSIKSTPGSEAGVNPNIAGLIGVKDAFKQLVTNVPESGKEFLSNIFQAIRHPIQTGKAVVTIGKGAFQKLIPGEQKDEAAFDQLTDFFADRYGSLEKFSEAAIKDPVGVAADISTILTAGGAVAVRTAGIAGKAGKAGKIAEVGKIVGEVGKRLDPIGGTVGGIGRIAQRPPINTMIKSVLKFSKVSKDIKLTRIDELANSFLRQGLNVTRKSLDDLTIKRQGFKQAIDGLIGGSTKEGVRMSTGKLVKVLDELVDEAAQKGIELPDLKIIKQMRDNFVKQHGNTITPKQMQQIKVGLNRRFAETLEGEFSAVKALVREKLRVATKSALEELHPELKTLNQDTAIMKQLKKAIEGAIITGEETQTLGTKGLIVGGGAGAVAGASTGSAISGLQFGAAAFTLEKILTNPRLQIKVARALHAANLQLARIGKLSTLTQPAFQAGRIQQEMAQ